MYYVFLNLSPYLDVLYFSEPVPYLDVLCLFEPVPYLDVLCFSEPVSTSSYIISFRACPHLFSTYVLKNVFFLDIMNNYNIFFLSGGLYNEQV